MTRAGFGIENTPGTTDRSGFVWALRTLRAGERFRRSNWSVGDRTIGLFGVRVERRTENGVRALDVVYTVA
jgi:hypothetical protein